MPPATSPGLDDRLARVRFRRALALLVMTLLMPGSAQLVAGRKDVGRIALRIWFGGIALVVLVAGLGMLRPGFAYWLLSSTFVLGAIRVVLFVLALGWAALFLDAWRLGQPLGLRQKQRLAMVGINGFLCFSVAGSLLFASHVVGVQRDFITAMFGSGPASGAHDGRYNVLLLGGDSGAGRWGMRHDSITVASIDAETGRTVLFGLPRNMTDFPFPKGSVLEEQFPDGYDCDGCYLNSLSTFAEDNKELFTTYDDPGVEATIEGVEGITGLRMNYYVTVNLKGFEDLVDALGGVTLNVRDRIPVGGLGSDVTGYIEPGTRKLTGFETLWFARAREGSDDYSRMARQKCVMNALLTQASPQVALRNFQDIAEAGTAMVSTNLPAGEVDRFIDLALKVKGQKLATVSFVPPMVNTADPDIDLIQSAVVEAIDRAEGKGAASAKPAKPTKKQPQSVTGGSVGSLREGYSANEAEDLDAAC